jgi:NAD(P)H-dependent FMN reductase
MKPAKTLVLAGSIRTGSLNRKLAGETANALRRAGVEATFADLRDYPMPIYDGDLEAASGLPENARTLKVLAREADGFAIVSPEYNGSYPAVLKNAMDWMSRPEPGEGPLEAFRGKPAAVLSASPGPGGGARVLKQLRELLEMMRMKVTPHAVSLARSADAFDADGHLLRPNDIDSLNRLAAQLAAAAQEEIHV